MIHGMDEIVGPVARAICAASPRNWEIYCFEFEEEARAAIEAHKAALAEAGFVIVPRKPTEALRNAVRPWLADDRGNIVDDDQCDSLIEVVIDAALGPAQDETVRKGTG